MDKGYVSILIEIREMLKTLTDGQERLIKSIDELKEEQKKIYQEMKDSNSVLINLPLRSEFLN